jgi:hypothetical protein
MKTSLCLIALAGLLPLSLQSAQAQDYITKNLASWPADFGLPTNGTGNNTGWYYRVGTSNSFAWTADFAPYTANNQPIYLYPINDPNQGLINSTGGYAMQGAKRTVFHYNPAGDTSVVDADFSAGIRVTVSFRRTNVDPGPGSTMEFKVIQHSPSPVGSELIYSEPVNDGDVNQRVQEVNLPNFRFNSSLEISVGATASPAYYTSYDLKVDVQRRPVIRVGIDQPFTRNTFLRPFANADQAKFKWRIVRPSSLPYQYQITRVDTGAIWVWNAAGVVVPNSPADPAGSTTVAHSLDLNNNWLAGEYELKCFTAGDTYVYPFHIVDQSSTSKSYSFTSEGIWLENGVPFVPIGIYHAVIKESVVNGSYNTNFTPNKFLDDIIDKGFNAVHISNQTMAEATPDGRTDFPRWADLVQARNVSRNLSNDKKLRVVQWLFDDQFIASNVNSMRDHQALMAWNFADEPKWETFDRNLGISNLLRGQPSTARPRHYSGGRSVLASGADPRHPIIIGSWYFDECNIFSPMSDVITTSNYPVQFPDDKVNKTYWALRNGFISQLATLDDDNGRINNIQKLPNGPASLPFMPTLQAFGSDDDRLTFKIPSPWEYRNMAFQGIARGARSFLVYGYTNPDLNSYLLSGLQFWLANPTASLETRNLWATVGQVNREIRALTPFLTTPGGSSETVVGSAAVKKAIRVLKRNTGANAAIYVCVNLDTTLSQTFGITLPTANADLRPYTFVPSTAAGSWQTTGIQIPKVTGQPYANVIMSPGETRLLRVTW